MSDRQERWWDQLAASADADDDVDEDSDDDAYEDPDGDSDSGNSDTGSASGSGSGSGSEDPADDDQNVGYDHDAFVHDIRIIVTPYRPSRWPRLVPNVAEAEAEDPLAPIRALAAAETVMGLRVYENMVADGGHGLGLQFVWQGLERFQSVLDAIQASNVIGLAVDIGGEIDWPPVQWQADCVQLVLSQLALPALQYLDLGNFMLPDQLLAPALPALLQRCPRLAHLTLPAVTRPSYAPFWSPIIANSLSLLTFCVHGCRSGRRSILEPAFQSWCKCHHAADPNSNKWPKKWMAPLLRNRFLQTSVRRAVFGTLVAARVLFRGHKAQGPDAPRVSLLDLPPEILTMVLWHANPCSWALTAAQVRAVVIAAEDPAAMGALAWALARTLPSSVLPVRDGWLVDNGFTYQGDRETADAQFEAYQASAPRPAPRRARRR